MVGVIPAGSKLPDLATIGQTWEFGELKRSAEIPTLLTLEETTAILKVHPTTVRRWVKRALGVRVEAQHCEAKVGVCRFLRN